MFHIRENFKNKRSNILKKMLQSFDAAGAKLSLTRTQLNQRIQLALGQTRERINQQLGPLLDTHARAILENALACEERKALAEENHNALLVKQQFEKLMLAQTNIAKRLGISIEQAPTASSSSIAASSSQE